VTMAGKALLLLSGGIDSPVAGHLIARQGLEVLAVHFFLEPITDDAAAVKSRRLAERLGISKLVVVIVGPAFAEIAKVCDLRLYFVLSKRLMVRIAEAIARRDGGAPRHGPARAGGPRGGEGRKLDIRPALLNGLIHDVLSPEAVPHRHRVHLHPEESAAVPARGGGGDAEVLGLRGHGPEGDARRRGGSGAHVL